MEFEVLEIAFAGRWCRTRLPFRFGVVTLTEAPVLTCRVALRGGGARHTGFSGDLCVPRWFDKDPARTPADDVRALFASARRAAAACAGRGGSVFEIWRAAHRTCVEGEAASGVSLVDGFGVALVERALIDAACRAASTSFREAVAKDLLGFDPGLALPGGSALRPADLVATPAAERVALRHTVGGLDPLRASEVSPELRGEDGHPISLEEDIERYGLHAFKLKAGGEPAADAARLVEIARVVAGAGVAQPLYTLDANEQYPDLDRLGELLRRLEADTDGRLLLEGLRYVEQPLPRALTFDPASRDALGAIASSVPLIIDEADDAIDAFSRALDLGYRGVSVKNCKGVFRALANRALCLERGDGAFQTSEDLTNLPVLPLQQDLATLALLGLEHSERNGHHFFPGLDLLPAAEAEAALAAQPDLYRRRGDRIELAIDAGSLSLACQDRVGYGYASEIAWAARSDLDALEATAGDG